MSHSSPHSQSYHSYMSNFAQADSDTTVGVSPGSPAYRPSYFTRMNRNYLIEEDIRRGYDVRTTVMIRNVPNRLTAAELKDILDAYCFGLYDFVYLRIDFSNGCNVGYAFVNFILPQYILLLCDAIRGKRWANSDKIAEISYATNQGRESLIAKFRNSSVMREAPTSRPKLFYAFPHPMVGVEEDFPQPDNPIKLSRSIQNAACIGLYQPRGHPGRYQDNRNRFGTFDRGTSYAIAEERFLQQRPNYYPHHQLEGFGYPLRGLGLLPAP